MKEYVIETKQVTKSYGSFLALNHVDLHVKRGHIYGLVGDNGAGKSTLLKILAGHSYATEGEIRLFGKYGKKQLQNARKNIGCIIEQPGFFPNMTVEQTLKYYCIQKGISNHKKISEIMELTGITEKRTCQAGTLSLGQKQRLGIAIAIIGEPGILILDEPINGMDPSGILEFRQLFHRLKDEKNITILLSSHILTELQQIADDYGFLSKGVLVEEITAEELEKRCADCMEIVVSDVDKYSAAFERTFPKDDYKVLPDHTIRIYKPKETQEAYSRLALKQDICITGMQMLRTSLEDYYIKLKERGAKQC